MKKDPRYVFILVILLLSLLSSLLLTVKPISEICDVNEGCEVVAHSTYNTTFGVKNSLFGSIIFFILCIACFIYLDNPLQKTKRFIDYSIFLGSIVALYFLYIQAFVLQAFCKYCLVVDIGLLVAAAVILSEKWMKKFLRKEQKLE